MKYYLEAVRNQFLLNKWLSKCKNKRDLEKNGKLVFQKKILVGLERSASERNVTRDPFSFRSVIQRQKIQRASSWNTIIDRSIDRSIGNRRENFEEKWFPWFSLQNVVFPRSRARWITRDRSTTRCSGFYRGRAWKCVALCTCVCVWERERDTTIAADCAKRLNLWNEL